MRRFAPLAALTLCACANTPAGQPDGPDVFAAVAAERAACRPVEGPSSADPAGLRIAEYSQLDAIAPGGVGRIRVTLAEVDGRGFNEYPNIRLTPGDDALRVLAPDAAQWYGIQPCGAYTADLELAVDPGARGPLPLTISASTLRCDREGGCADLHAVEVAVEVE